MKITWIGHSCFKIEEAGYRVVFDPYDDGYVPGLGPVRETAEEVLCSHEHGDHNARKRVTLVSGSKSPFTVTKIETYHDPQKGALRGRNTIHILSGAGKRIAHFGDLGCELPADQLAQLENLDIAMIPVGGHYTIDAAQAADLVRKINPAHVIPMHYRGDDNSFGFDVIGTVREFTDLMDSVTFTGSYTVDLDNLPSEQVLVLKPQNA
jgi:L-ascorbate metabolism protein UlaG (beta-lactamase superfamily)